MKNSLDTGKKILENGNQVTVFEIDLDYFKQVNDNYGHLVGNKFLIYVAEVLKEEMHEFNSIVGRLGGDEFIIIVENYPDDLIKNLEKRLLELLHNKIKVREPELLNIKIGFSIGYAKSNLPNSTLIQDLLSEADTNMYYNKFHKKMLDANKVGILNLPKETIRFIHLLMEKDIYTYIHSEKTAQYASIIAKELQLPSCVINEIYIAAWLHDIGNLYVPIYILRKPSSLNKEEYSIIKRHVTDSLNILEQFNLSFKIVEIIKYHHERWDGNGYPFNLKETDIPLEARILHIADAYSAMTLKHFYKKALTKERAIKEIEFCSGTQFDPELVQVFVKYLKIH